MIEITLEDAKNILILTDKVQISGREAMYIAQLQIKLQKELYSHRGKLIRVMSTS